MRGGGSDVYEGKFSVRWASSVLQCQTFDEKVYSPNVDGGPT